MKNRYIIFFGSVLFDMLAAVVSFFLALAVGGIAYYDCGRQLFYFTNSRLGGAFGAVVLFL